MVLTFTERDAKNEVVKNLSIVFLICERCSLNLATRATSLARMLTIHFVHS